MNTPKKQNNEFISRYTKLLRFLKHIWYKENGKFTYEQIKGLDVTSFMSIISVANWILRNEERFQKWRNRVSRVLICYWDNTDDPDLEPPVESYSEFIDLYLQIQSPISTYDNEDIIWVKLYIWIVFAHMFDDGNGRVARMVYWLMHWRLDEKIIFHRGWKLMSFCEQINLEAIRRCYNNHWFSIGNIAEMQNGTYFTNINWLPYTGYTTHLKWLSLKMNWIGSTDLGKLTQLERKAFEKAYNALRKEWFWEAQNCIETNSDWAIQTLDDALS